MGWQLPEQVAHFAQAEEEGSWVDEDGVGPDGEERDEPSIISKWIAPKEKGRHWDAAPSN